MASHINDRLYRSLGVPLVQVFKDGTLVTGKAIIEVGGVHYHAIQMDHRDGTDVIQVQGSLDGMTYFPLNAPLNALNADNVYFFVGDWNFLEFSKASGTGTATNLFYSGHA